MNILILDDDDTRHALLERALAKEHVLFHAFNANEAIELLTKAKFTKIKFGLALLDHDLQDFYIDEDRTKRERHGVYFILKMMELFEENDLPAQFVIHSHNHTRAKEMAMTLANTAIVATIPFSDIMIQEVKRIVRSQ